MAGRLLNDRRGAVFSVELLLLTMIAAIGFFALFETLDAISEMGAEHDALQRGGPPVLWIEPAPGGIRMPNRDAEDRPAWRSRRAESPSDEAPLGKPKRPFRIVDQPVIDV